MRIVLDAGTGNGVSSGIDPANGASGHVPSGCVGPGRITWIPVDQKVILHVSNAYDTPDGKVVLEGPAYNRAAWSTSWRWWVGAPGSRRRSTARLRPAGC